MSGLATRRQLGAQFVDQTFGAMCARGHFLPHAMPYRTTLVGKISAHVRPNKAVTQNHEASTAASSEGRSKRQGVN